MDLAASPTTVFRIILLIVFFVLNIISFRCVACTCRKRRCLISPLFLVGNLLTLLLWIPDLVVAFGHNLLTTRSTCSFDFIASNLLCSYFVALGVLRLVLASVGLKPYHRYFFACLLFTPLLAAGIQLLSAETATEEPLMMHLTIGKPPYGRKNELKIPLVTCAKNICGSADVLTTILSTIVPALVPIVSFAVVVLVSLSIRKKFRENYRLDSSNNGLVIPEFCEREQTIWPILKFVLVLVAGWTVFAKPTTLLLTWLTRLYADGGSEETSVYVCANFWDVGNNVILFISACVTPVFFVSMGRSLCRKADRTSDSGSQRVFLDRPITVIGDGGFMDVGTFTWDTFHFRSHSHEESTEKSVA